MLADMSGEFATVLADLRVEGDRDDLALSAVGADADRWPDIAQAYVGPPGKGRRPGQFG